MRLHYRIAATIPLAIGGTAFASAQILGGTPPSISITQPDGPEDWADDTFTIRWVDADADDDANVRLWYDTDNVGFDGTQITTGPISEDDPADSLVWSTASLPEGDYWIYARISDGTNPTVSVYSYHPVRIWHPPVTKMPALPGAEGSGRYTKGGRGGEVVTVYNLNRDGMGSLREAVTRGTNRFVVFAVSGTIDLDDNNPATDDAISITNDHITVAGQTAPGEGILIKGAPTKIRGNEVIFQHLRFRKGTTGFGESSHADAVTVKHVDHVFLDHLSTSWANDENLSVSGDIKQVTVQHSIMAEGLNYVDTSVDPERHGLGSLVGSENGGKVAFHHNLWAHHSERSPRIDNGNNKLRSDADIRNNVIYNCSIETGDCVTGAPLSVNYVGNYLKAGPSTPDGVYGGLVGCVDEPLPPVWPPNSPPLDLRYRFFHQESDDMRMYAADNFAFGNAAVTADNWLGMAYTGTTEYEVRRNAPWDLPFVATTDAETALADVLGGSGATLPSRDAVDLRITREVADGTGEIICDLSGPPARPYPILWDLGPLTDTDADGMPDFWELQFGLDINTDDSALDGDSDGWTNIEAYVHNLDPDVDDTPVVFVHATDSRADESASDGGSVRFVRGGERSLHNPLTVTYAVSGTASADDYVQLSGTVLIPIGETHVDVAITPLSNAQGLELDETVIVEVATSSIYARGCPLRTMVVITE
ncbi:MAG: hypothetical protein GY722_09545 [bacterium]|nr:hypothetical protein [bacterium]